MPSDYENGAKKTIDISIKAEKMTADVLKSALQEFLSGKAEKKGRMTYKQLQAKSPSKLDSIEVSDRNISREFPLLRSLPMLLVMKQRQRRMRTQMKKQALNNKNLFSWCRWRGSNPHGVATNGF